MNIFYNRPLFTSCTVFLAASVASYFLSLNVNFIILAVFAVILIASTLLMVINKVKESAKDALLHVLLCSLAVVLAISCSVAYYKVKANKFEDIYGDEHVIKASVLSVDYESEFFSSYVVSVNELDGEVLKHKARLVCEYSAAPEIGEVVILRAVATEPDDSRDGKYREKISMLSDGMFVSYTSYDHTGIIITDQEKFDVSVFFAKINSTLSRVITDRVEGEAGNLSSAVLLGNKELLSGVTVRDFSRAGVSHILALSGLHMSVIMGAFTALIWLFTKNGKVVGVIGAILAILYLALTGFSVSATRAVIMLLIVYISLIVFAAPDALTSLSVAGAIIVAASPGAILDAGFWMSFGATLGILVFLPPLHEFVTDKLYSKIKSKPRKIIVRTVTYVIDIVAASVFAIVPIVIVMCIFIKEMSLFSIVSSVVLSLPTTALLFLSLLLVCLFYVPYLSGWIVFLIERIASFMIGFCADISATEGAVFSLNYPFIWIFAIILGVALLYCFASNHKRKVISAIPFVLCLLLTVVVITAYEYVNRNTVRATYVNSSSASDILVLSNEREVVICDLTNGSKTSYSDALDEVYAARATEIRAIMLTGYTHAHSATLTDVFSEEMVRELWVPYPRDIEDYSKMARICEIAEKFNVTVKIYEEGYTLTAFENTRIELHQDVIERSAVPVSVICVSTSNDRLVYASSAFNESDKCAQIADQLFEKTEYVVIGNKGPKVKIPYTVTDSRRVNAIAFASYELISQYDASQTLGAAYFYVPDRIEFYLDE